MAALNATTGHTHDGSSNNGPEINITNLTVGSQAQGDLIYASSASAWARLPKGSASQILAMNGGATAPEWVTPTSVASQAEMETATDITKSVTPGRVQYHPGVAKAWVNFNGTGTPAVNASHNVDSSITDHGTGEYTISFTTDFSSANYAYAGMATLAGEMVMVTSQTASVAGTKRVYTRHVDGSAKDPTEVCLVAFGDQA